MKKSIAFGLDRDVTKSNVLFLFEKCLMLNQKNCQFTFPHDINLLFDCFCTCNFVVYCFGELEKINDFDFNIHEDKFGVFLRFLFHLENSHSCL
jgi:hypothetical protein